MSNSILFPSTGKVYLLSFGKCDDYEVFGVASTPEKAKNLWINFQTKNGIS